MRKLLGPGDVFIDVGAHIGWFTTVASKCVGDGRVVAFEPFVTNAFVLKENLKANSCDNVVVVEAALGEQAEQYRSPAEVTVEALLHSLGPRRSHRCSRDGSR